MIVGIRALSKKPLLVHEAMAFDSEVAAIVEKQTRGRGEQPSHTKRSKSKGPSMDALEIWMTGLEDTISGM